MLEEFLALIDNVNIEDIGGDHWVWTVDPSNIFTIKSTYLALHNLKVGPNEEEVFKRL